MERGVKSLLKNDGKLALFMPYRNPQSISIRVHQFAGSTCRSIQRSPDAQPAPFKLVRLRAPHNENITHESINFEIYLNASF